MCNKKSPTPDNAEDKKSINSLTRLTREVDRVRDFFQSNPHLWYDLCNEAEHHINANRRFGIQAIVERWRWYRPAISDGRPFKISNSWCAIIARLLIEAYPEAANLVERRSSIYDQVFEPEVMMQA